MPASPRRLNAICRRSIPSNETSFEQPVQKVRKRILVAELLSALRVVTADAQLGLRGIGADIAEPTHELKPKERRR